MPPPQDRRVRRTRNALRDALIGLMTEKGYEAVTVQDIIDRADVGRSTFYAHFTDKRALLESGLAELREHLADVPAEGDSPGLFAFSLELFRHCHEQRRLFQALAGKKSEAFVRTWFMEMVVDLVRNDLAAALPASTEANVPLDVTAEFIAGGYMALVEWGLDSPEPRDPEEMDRVFRQLATPVAGAALGQAALRRP